MVKDKKDEKPSGNIGKGIGLGFGACIGIVVFIIVLIVVGLIVHYHNNPSATPSTLPSSQVTSQAKTYQQVFSFTGNGIKNSDTFTITGDKFKIIYDCTGQLCQASIKKPSTGDPLKDAVNIQYFMNTAGNAKDETILYGAGQYYINANTMGTFNITVDDYK